MNEYPVCVTETECRGCYKCVDRCPVKAIRVQNGSVSVIPKMCIFCGNCVRACPAQARKARNDIATVKKLLRQDKKTFVSLAPSFSSEFFGCSPRQLTAALKCLGFFAVSETALGADFVSAGIAAALKEASENEGGQKLFLSSACPAVVLYLKRYASAFVPYLNNRASPLLAHAQLLRGLYGQRINVVFIGPCIAKKCEADQFKEISAAITFNELREWLREEEINPHTISETENDGFVPRRAAKGAFYPVDGGMIISMRKYKGFSKTANMVISGINTIAETLNAVTRPDGLETPLFLELLSCQGGCINGPCATRDASAISRRARLLRYAESADDVLDAETASRTIPLFGELTAVERQTARHSPEEIRLALEQTGKYSVTDEVNCSKCGYRTCRDFADALLEKRAEKTMCAPYMRALAQKKANGLMNAMPGGVVIVEKTMHIIECNRNFARLMGSEIEELYEITAQLAGFNLNKIPEASVHFEEVFSPMGGNGAHIDGMGDSFDCEIRIESRILHLNIFVIEKGEIAAGVFTDVTVPQIRRDRTVSKIKSVIEKNVKTVQKIAFLLGENAAETEAILTSIIKSYEFEKEGK
jgi:iron only hydrogenase large subunit-like protein